VWRSYPRNPADITEPTFVEWITENFGEGDVIEIEADRE
jgi:hypothetical protein